MKKNFMKLFFASVATIAMTSCATMSTPAGFGSIYADVKTGEHVTSNDCGTKVGTASATNILGLVLLGDASINAAAKSAGIKRISHVDSEKKSILGIFATYKVIVYGE